MSYLTDLDKCIENAEALIEKMEECRDKGYPTAYRLFRDDLDGIIKSIRHCLRCVNRRRERRLEKMKAGETPPTYKKFDCVGGCIRTMPLEEWRGITNKLDYVNELFPVFLSGDKEDG